MKKKELNCGHWIRDKDGVAAFRCGDKSNKGIELCLKCKEIKEITKSKE